MAKDCADSIRDPQSLDLPPVRCVAAGTLALSGTAHNMKNQAAVIVFALEQQLLMSRILKCDVEGVRQILAQLEVDCSKFNRVLLEFEISTYNLFFFAGSNSNAVQSVLNERCDGNRNIFHAVVSMCSPTSNKETDTGEYCIHSSWSITI